MVGSPDRVRGNPPTMATFVPHFIHSPIHAAYANLDVNRMAYPE